MSDSLITNYEKRANYLHYKEYVGTVEFSEKDAVFHGKVIGVKSLISFEGDSVSAITEDFHNAVDEYLAFCVENEIKPEKSFKGSFNVRIGADLHRKAALKASERGISLNTLVGDAIRHAVGQRKPEEMSGVK
jgi:predicted HicB family RNase H-like nuclease